MGVWAAGVSGASEVGEGLKGRWGLRNGRRPQVLVGPQGRCGLQGWWGPQAWVSASGVGPQ